MGVARISGISRMPQSALHTAPPVGATPRGCPPVSYMHRQYIQNDPPQKQFPKKAKTHSKIRPKIQTQKIAL
jgi:hypothetical protein